MTVRIVVILVIVGLCALGIASAYYLTEVPQPVSHEVNLSYSSEPRWSNSTPGPSHDGVSIAITWQVYGSSTGATLIVEEAGQMMVDVELSEGSATFNSTAGPLSISAFDVDSPDVIVAVTVSWSAPPGLGPV